MAQKLFLTAFQLVLVELYRFTELNFDCREPVQCLEQVLFRNYSECCIVSSDNSCSAGRVRQDGNLAEVLALVQCADEDLFLLLVADKNVAITTRNNVEVGGRLALGDSSYFRLLHHHTNVVDQNLLERRLVFKHRILFYRR